MKNINQILGVSFLLFSLFGCSQHIGFTDEIKYLKNDNLKTIKKGFKGNLVKNDFFQNLDGVSGRKELWDGLKLLVAINPQREEKKSENYKLKVITDKSIFKEKRDYICWLGHASFLIQIDGKKILTDPCLSSPPMVKRLSALPFPIEEINPDYILISHGHYDHFDAESLAKFDNVIALIPLQMKELLNEVNPNIKTQEAGWFQKYNIDEKFEIFFLPSQHWHRRGAVDVNKILWGSYIIKFKGKTIYFAGDTGYSEHFKEIAKIFAPIDIALMPIGAYKPRYLMKANHMSPQDALKASQDLKAKMIIPMHYGTFDLGDEPLGEPERIFTKITKEENLKVLNVGEKMLIGF